MSEHEPSEEWHHTTFKRLDDGTWAVRTTQDVAIGDEVDVLCADGETRTVQITEIISEYPYDGETNRICSFEWCD